MQRYPDVAGRHKPGGELVKAYRAGHDVVPPGKRHAFDFAALRALLASSISGSSDFRLS